MKQKYDEKKNLTNSVSFSLSRSSSRPLHFTPTHSLYMLSLPLSLTVFFHFLLRRPANANSHITHARTHTHTHTCICIYACKSENSARNEEGNLCSLSWLRLQQRNFSCSFKFLSWNFCIAYLIIVLFDLLFCNLYTLLIACVLKLTPENVN